MTDILLILPEAFLALGAMLLLLWGAIRGDGTYKGMGLAGLLVLAGTGVLVVRGPAEGIGFHGMFVVDAFARYVKILLLGAAGLSLLLSMTYWERIRSARPEYPVIILFGSVGMMLMASANDFLMLYVGLELQSMALYILATFRRDHPGSSEAGLKYFVLSALASGVLLYGISIFYGLSGHTQFDALALGAYQTPPSFAALLALAFVMAGLAFKISAVPFHMWTPDVYEGAPSPASAFFASAPKLAALTLLVRLLNQPLVALHGEGAQIVIFLAAASMLVGSFGGLGQAKLKRLMAYSAIANMGAALVGLAAGGTGGVAALLVYMTLYLVNTLGAFAIILCLSRGGEPVDKVTDLSGLAKTHPRLALLMSFFMFSLAGVPPLAGFFGKYIVFLAAVETGLGALAALGIVSSVVAAAYYLKIVKTMYCDDVLTARLDPVPQWSLRFATAITGAAVLVFAFVPAFVIEAAQNAAKSLLTP